MRTPLGTDYATLRRLALQGTAPTRLDCALAERLGRAAHAAAQYRQAMQDLLIARALWSAWRASRHSNVRN